MNLSEKKELIELLNKNWMTHDGMWFYHCLQAVGIEATNRLNKSAIAALAPIEIKRLLTYLGLKKSAFNSYPTFKAFFQKASELFIPNFMNVTMSFPGSNRMHWEFKPYKCFAYKGMVAAGVVDQYECGVIYRIECWIKHLGIQYTVQPKITNCLMLRDGHCTGDFFLEFS